MTDNENKSGKKLGLLGGAPSRPGQVRQSFSHGRSKSVVVETKRKRVVVPKHNTGTSQTNNSQTATTPSKTPGGISSSELDRRKKALAAARQREALDKDKRDAEEKSREQEREQKRAVLETKEKAFTKRSSQKERLIKFIVNKKMLIYFKENMGIRGKNNLHSISYNPSKNSEASILII